MPGHWKSIATALEQLGHTEVLVHAAQQTLMCKAKHVRICSAYLPQVVIYPLPTCLVVSVSKV